MHVRVGPPNQFSQLSRSQRRVESAAKYRTAEATLSTGTTKDTSGNPILRAIGGLAVKSDARAENIVPAMVNVFDIGRPDT